MIEIPESTVISRQAETILIDKQIVDVVQASSPHRFTWYSGDPILYHKLLVGHRVEALAGHGSFIDILLDGNVRISISDGVNMKFYLAIEKYPVKHQLLILFRDKSFLAFTVSMYGAIYAYNQAIDNFYYQNSVQSLSPLDETFNKTYFEHIFTSVKKDMSIKALLATEQRIPGLGNGVLQDILFNAGIHPKRKISTISDLQKDDLFHSLKVTLHSMTNNGGRNTEKDFYGNFGGYKCLLSRNTYKNPCPNCGGTIVKEAYLGGTIYYCRECQSEK